MKKLWMIGLVALGACAAVWGRPEVKPPSAPSYMMVVTESFVDSTVAIVSCGTAGWRAAQNISTCRWTNGSVGGVAKTIPNGVTARFVFSGAEGAEANATVTAAGVKVVNAKEYVGPTRTANWQMKIGVTLPTAPDTLIITVN